MIEHLFNCHGEWQILFAALGSAPIVGVWCRALCMRGEKNDENR